MRPWRARSYAITRASSARIRGGSWSERPRWRRELRRAYLLPDRGSAALRIERRSVAAPGIELAFDEEREARACLRALGFDVQQAVVSFRAGAPFEARLWRVMLVMLVGFVATVPLIERVIPRTIGPAALLIAIVLGVLLVYLWPRRIDVGADGLALHGIGRRRRVPYSALSEVRLFTESRGRRRAGVVLHLHEHASITVPVGRALWRQREAESLAGLIERALVAYRTGGGDGTAGWLERRSRSTAQWVTGLRRTGAGADADPRHAPIAEERLWRVLEDPAEAPLARAAAAVALSAHADESETCPRLRAAARASVSAELSYVLERAAVQDTDERLAAALEELERCE